MKAFLNNLELILTAAGLVVIFGATLLTPATANRWEVAAVTAIAVGVLHGVIFWLVRRRQRQVRQQALEEVAVMLRDIVNNQLTIIQAGVHVAQTASPEADRAVTHIGNAVQEISGVLRNLSEESIRRWRSKYGRVLPPR
ncbi:MAG TPA: hypothetical protein VGD88_16795 [Opitutaceae bacterium]